ncbi:hypothetical protein WA026_002538 [Henosepilachna vigintioctopunctata]|uniref:Gag protein n=1 Tax=Henosepilachna vigintioctopunctata TaxID=420089 RepID=A0AAW1TZZ4_9CUCU
MCVKCGRQHDSKTCTKPKSTSATCALCEGSHLPNYKDCQVYKQLFQNKNQTTQRRNRQQNIPEPTTGIKRLQNHATRTPELSYAEATRNHQRQQELPTQDPTTLETMMVTFLSDLKSMMTQLINQNQIILNLLTIMTNKLK